MSTLCQHSFMIFIFAALAVLAGCSNHVASDGVVDPDLAVDGGFEPPDASVEPDAPPEDDVEPIAAIDAVFYRLDPEGDKNFLSWSVAGMQYRYDFATSTWMDEVDRLQTGWAQDPNGPFYEDPDTPVGESVEPLDAAYYRRDGELGKHYVSLVRGSVEYRYDFTLGAWKQKRDRVADGRWSTDPDAPFYDDPDTAEDESSIPVDAMFFRLDPERDMHILSFVRGTTQYRYDYDTESWKDKIDRKEDGAWASDPNGPFHDDPATPADESTLPLDGTFYRADPISGDWLIGFVRGPIQYIWNIEDRSWKPRKNWSALGSSDNAPF